MSTLTELTSHQHSNLHLVEHCQLSYAETLHLLNIRLNEVGQSLCSMPIFLTKDPKQGLWRLSAITSFSLGTNLWVENNKWLAPYQPTSIQTYPFYLMDSPKEQGQYTIGINENSEAFSTTQGNALFNENGKANEHLSHVKQLLEADIQHDINTFHFGRLLNELGLCKTINLLIRYSDNTTQKITGLTTIDEDKLQNLSADNLMLLNKKGYLTAIHGLLLSLLQLNALIQRNNNRNDLPKIQNIKLEVNK